MLKFAVGCMLSVVLTTALNAADPLKLDAKNSKIEFVGKKADGQHVGGFKTFKVDSTANPASLSAGVLTIEIDTASIWSDDDRLTNHLKNPDFFDVRKHPKIKFVSSKIEQESPTKATITGDLTMLGKTESVTLPAELKTDGKSLQLVTSFKIDRTKWGMNYGVGKVNNEVDVTATLALK